ncbi:hypothetical protein Vafri_6834 [Volvox africanus]|uniref:PAS domain-containing protein n=1 Tax=Volvox africanus TaxID=51714 RepID=A0A8J4B111_9CHLO|nr:hypothetical protein Vafri_6834 [Volvox africanus]
MATSGASSYGGSGGSSKSSFTPKRDRSAIDQDQEQGDNLLDRRSSLEYGIFGVLFTLSKEKSEHRIRIRWVLLKILLDGWQLFTTVISPERQPWSIKSDSMSWLVIGVLNFTWLGNLGYGVYLAVLYSVLALLAINIGMCVWVAWCFKEHKFPVVWPIKVLRVFSSVFFQAFDVASLNLLQLGITCRFTGSKSPKLHFDLFDRYSCTAPPHIMHAIVSALCLILFVCIALLLNMAEVEVNPLSRRPMALGHSGAEVMAFAIKVLMTMVNVFIGWNRVEASIYLALSLALAWQTLRWSPHLVDWVNYLKAGVSAMVVWCSVALMLLVFHPGTKSSDQRTIEKWNDVITILMLAGITPAFGVGALISRALLAHARTTALRGLENPKKLPVMEVFSSIDEPRDVEIVSRYCRNWKEPCVLDPDAVNKAHHLIKAGLEMFPTSAFMVLLHANFMIDVLGISQSGSRRIEDARKLNPSLMCRFIMFVRQQEATQHAAGSSVSATMDLLGYVEYQRKQRMVVRLHREALQAMCNFWKALDASTVSFTHLSKSLAKIETSVSQAQRAYRVVLESYGNNPKLVHLYGRFLQTIKNDPWHAAEYFAEAERLEELQDSNAGGPLMPDGTPLTRMDEIDTAVLVLNAVGEVQMANRHTQHLFGYKRGALEGKPLATLLAPHYARRLAERLASIATAHELLGTSRSPAECAEMGEEMVVGLHSDRLAFQAKLSLSKASGVGEDSTIIALVEPVAPTPGVCSFWVTHNGIVTACDPSFVANFGWKANEVNGTSIKGLLIFPAPPNAKVSSMGAGAGEETPQVLTARHNESATEIIKRLLSEAAVQTDALIDLEAEGGYRPPPGVSVLVPHKYIRNPLKCTLTIIASASTDSPVVHEFRIKVDRDPVQLLAVNRKGIILHASAELAARFKERSGAHLGGLGEGHAGHGHEGHHQIAQGEGMLEVGNMMNSSAALNGYTLFDFLSPAWKEMHFKLLKEITTVSPQPVSELSCRKSALAGPTLEMRTAGGRPIYMHVGVATTEVQGEMVHIVHMARSSLPEALAERRLRLSVSSEGLIALVESGNASQLFGMDANKFVGRGLWEILEEHEQPSPTTVRASNSTIITRDITALIKRALKYPGHSWRVQLVPPPSRGTRVSFTQQARPAIMQVHVVIPPDDDEAVDPTIQVDLWPVSTVVGVLDLDQYGRIRAVLEEQTRPAGLLFGVPTKSLIGTQLGEFVAMPPGRTKPNDLLFLHATKKSSLKTQAKEASIKVGPVHMLRATHLDGRPVNLNVQVIGKPGSNEPLTAILKIYQAPLVPLIMNAPPQPPQPQSQKQQAQPSQLPMRAPVVAGAARATADKMRMAAPVITAPTQQTITIAAKVLPGGVEETDLAMYEDADLEAMKKRAAACTAPAGAISPQRTPSLEESKPRASSPWRKTGGAPGPAQSPPVVRALSTPPAAKLITGTSILGEFSTVTVLPNQEIPNTDGRSSVTAANGRGGSLLGRSKLVDMVKAVGVDRSGSGHQATPSRGATFADGSGGPGFSGRGGGGGGGGGGSRRLRSPMAIRKGPARSIEVPGSVQQVDVDEAEGGSIGQGGGASERAASDSDDHGSGFTKDTQARAATADRVLDWVASKGAFYQNSMSTSDVTKVEDCYRMSPNGFSTGGGVGSPPGGVTLERFPTSPISDSRSPPELKGRIGLGSPADGMSSPGATGFEDDDGGSEGGQSAVSGAQSATGSEYTRGKRFRKLVKLMDSSQTLQVQKRLRIHALVTVALLAVVHIICFVLTVMAIKQQKTSMLQLGRSGQAQLYMHRIMIDTRSLDVISHNKTVDSLYSKDKDKFFVNRISKDAEEVKKRFNEILNTHSKSPEILRLLYQTKRTVWDTNDADGSDIYTNLTIWDFATRFYSMAKQVEQLYEEWKEEKIFVADSYAGQFLLKSGPDLFVDSRKILDALLYSAVDNARRVDVLQIVFLLVEGAAISFFAACYLTFLLRAVAAQRFKLYSTFLIIPVGLTRALASQNLTLLVDEDEDDDGDDEDDRAAQAVSMQDNDEANATPKLRRRATLKVEESSETAGPASPGVTSPGWATARSRSPFRRNSESEAVNRNDHKYEKYEKQRSLTGDSAVSMDGAHVSTCCCGWGSWRLKLRNLLVRRSSILPMAMSNSVIKLAGFAGGVTKRSLKFDSHETGVMLLPFVVWSILVITIYAFAVIKMKGVHEVVAVHSVVNFMAARTSRTVFFCQELANVETASQLIAKRAALLKVVKLVRDAWYTLQLGNQAYTALGAGTEVFPLVKKGLSHASKEIEALFYSSGVCHRTSMDPPCNDEKYRFYQVTHTGLDSMMQQLMISLSSMATNSSMVPEGLEDEHFDFVYSVGYKDLLDGTTAIAEAHYNTIIDLFNGILMLHIILFLIFWIIFGGFLLFMLNPLLRRISNERRRIAELMSQLPLELDVERLVARALGTQTSVPHQHGAEGDRSVTGGAAGNTSGNEREAMETTTKWKAIIRASTSLNGKAPSMDGRKRP